MLSINKDVKIFHIAKYRKVVNKMGFWDGVGKALGKMAEFSKELKMYKQEYETMSNRELVELGKEISKGSMRYGNSTERSHKQMVIKAILRERGVIG